MSFVIIRDEIHMQHHRMWHSRKVFSWISCETLSEDGHVIIPCKIHVNFILAIWKGSFTCNFHRFLLLWFAIFRESAHVYNWYLLRIITHLTPLHNKFTNDTVTFCLWLPLVKDRCFKITQLFLALCSVIRMPVQWYFIYLVMSNWHFFRRLDLNYFIGMFHKLSLINTAPDVVDIICCSRQICSDNMDITFHRQAFMILYFLTIFL